MSRVDLRQLGAKATEQRVDGYVDAFLARVREAGQPEVRRSYLLLSIPRVGSNWLAHELRAEQELGYPYEWYQTIYMGRLMARLGRPFERDRYRDLVRAGSTTANGVFGLKAQIDQVLSMRREHGVDLLDYGFDRIVWIYRRDVVAQAHSYVRSLKSNVFSRVTAREREVEAIGNPHMVIETSAVLDAAARLTQWREVFEQHFRARADLCVAYEDMLAHGVDATVSDLRELLGLPRERRHPATRDYEKQVRDVDEERVRAIHAYLDGTGELPVGGT